MSDAARPYVDEPVGDPRRADLAARAAAREWELGTLLLLRRGMNVLYGVGDVVVRVGSTTAPPVEAHRLVDVLRSHGIPAVAPVEGMAGTFHGLSVTGWHRVPVVDRPADWAAIGRAVRRLHALSVDQLPSDYPLPSPVSFPWWDFDRLIDDLATDIDDAALAGLVGTVERHAGWREAIDASPVVCHGDVHPGNVLVDADGATLLIDWDLMCRADRGWDHAMLVTLADRWGGDPNVYGSFVAGYGASLADDELTQALAALRNVAATLMRVVAGRTDPAARAEAERRLRYWRGDPDAPRWRAQ